jgi:CheY-like chemotaxis protein
MTQKNKIMIVEDESIMALSLKMAFRRWGYEVFEPVAKGEQAVAHVEDLMPDLVLMDIGLAGNMDGIEAARQIRKTHDIPIIFMTGYHGDNLLERMKTVSCSTYLIKPFVPDEVLQAVEQALHQGYRRPDNKSE